MRRGHLPFGYRIEEGRAVIDEKDARIVRGIYESYLSGKTLQQTAKENGVEMTHSSVKNILHNPRYIGDGFYPKLIEKETFEAVEKERIKRAKKLGRMNIKKKPRKTIKISTAFVFRKGSMNYKDPYKHAAYLYSLIESEG